MTGGQEKNFSTLGPKLRENRAQQYYGDKSLQIRVETTNYFGYCHVSLHISDNLSPNLISSDILGKKRSRAFV